MQARFFSGYVFSRLQVDLHPTKMLVKMSCMDGMFEPLALQARVVELEQRQTNDQTRGDHHHEAGYANAGQSDRD